MILEIPITHGRLRLIPSAFQEDEATHWLNQLKQYLPWRQDAIRIAGRLINIPRLQCWLADPGCRYTYSGLTLEPQSWPIWISPLRDRVHTLTGQYFNSVLLNWYRHGQDSIAWHSDDEPELGINPFIASVSFGQTRIFSFKRRNPEANDRLAIPLPHGSLLMMSEELQHHWVHQISKTRKPVSERISLTFRQVNCPGGSTAASHSTD